LETRRIGGLAVSVVGLGANNFGTTFFEKVIDADATRSVLDAALDNGVNFIDTADVYGDSEAHIGQAIAGRRDQFVIATKFGSAMGSADRSGGSARWIAIAVEDSLRRLNIDTIDLYQLHNADPATPIEETLTALDALVRAGKVREIGCSNFSAAQIDEAAAVAADGGLAAFVSVQNRLNAINSQPLDDVIPACERHGLAMLPYSPLANGILSGKYRPGVEVTAGRLSAMPVEAQQKMLSAKTFARIDALTNFAAERGHTLLELAFAWLLAVPTVASVIAGATTPTQVAANAATAGWDLSLDDVAEVRRLVATAA
jgi:aryl-alcohol dehydrogenase-like predicted oxidoreductase